jgi:spore germination protein KB
MKDSKITFLQALLLFLVANYSPALRCIPSSTSGIAHQAAWLSPICGVIVFVPLLYVLYKIGKKFEGKSLHDILCGVFGKTVGKSLEVLCLIWLLIALGVCVKFAGANLNSTIFVGTDLGLLMFISILIVGVALRWGIAVLARMNKIIFVLMVAQFLLILFFLFLHFRPDYVTPISTLDLGPVLLSAVFPIGIFAYITPMFVFNDQIVYAKKNKGKLAFTVGYLAVKNTLIMLALIGMLSAGVISKQKLPFFSAVENIAVFKSSSGLDSLFMSIWMFGEFITISFFAYCASRLVKNIFGLKTDTPALTAILGFTFFFSVFLSSNLFELNLFMTDVSPYISISLGFILPILLFITAKIRKMI